MDNRGFLTGFSVGGRRTNKWNMHVGISNFLGLIRGRDAGGNALLETFAFCNL